MKSFTDERLQTKGLPQRFNRHAVGVRPNKPGVAQLKMAVSAQSVKRPVAPPVYRPQPVPRVLQTKARVGVAAASCVKKTVNAPVCYPGGSCVKTKAPTRTHPLHQPGLQRKAALKTIQQPNPRIQRGPMLPPQAPKLGSYVQAKFSNSPVPQHRSSAITYRPPRSLGGGTVIQCLISAVDFRQRIKELGLKRQAINEHNLYFKKIASALDRYHQESAPYLWGQQGYADKRLAALDEMEHAIYDWLNVNQASLTVEGERKFVMSLLDEIQQEHIELVDYVHSKNLKLYTPDRGQLDFGGQRALDEAWNQLRAGSGLVKFSASQTQANKELRSVHARLLSRPEGRGLMYEILKGKDDPVPFKVHVKYTPAYTSTIEKRTAIEQNKKLLLQLAEWRLKYQRELDYWEEISRNYEDKHQAWGDTYELRKKRLMEADPSYRQVVERMELLATKIEGIRDEIAKFGDSSFPAYAVGEPDAALAGAHTEGASVTFRMGLTDNSQRNFDSDRRHIPAPAFIIYGHELVHVLQRRYPTKMILDPMMYPKGHAKEHYHNTSEREAIREIRKLRSGAHLRFYENKLRREHGITARKFHTGKSLSEIEGR